MIRTREEQLEIERAALMRCNLRLRAQIADLRKAAPTAIDVPVTWKLTTSEMVIVRKLLQREAVSHEALMDALYSGVREPACGLKTLVCNARRKLRRMGFTIENRHGFGYFIPADQRQRLINMARGIHAEAA